MQTFRFALIALAVLQALLVGAGMLLGSFADGGYWWERLPLLLAHPAAAVALLFVAAAPHPSLRLARIALTLLLVGIASDALLSAAIGLGITRGDWWLPLAFAAIPTVGVVYTLTLLNRDARPEPPATAAFA